MQRFVLAGVLVVCGVALLAIRFLAPDSWFLRESAVVEAQQQRDELQILRHNASASRPGRLQDQAAADYRSAVAEYESGSGADLEAAKRRRNLVRTSTFYGGVVLLLIGCAVPFAQPQE